MAGEPDLIVKVKSQVDVVRTELDPRAEVRQLALPPERGVFFVGRARCDPGRSPVTQNDELRAPTATEAVVTTRLDRLVTGKSH